MKILILGASGGCGRWLVRLAIERGMEVRALVREQTPFDEPDGVELLRGDVLKSSVLDQALDGCAVIASALGVKRRHAWNPWSRVDSPREFTTAVTRLLLSAMPRHEITRLVCISAGGVADSFAGTHPIIRWMIRHSNMAASYQDLEQMELLLGATPLDWLAVRPTTLTPGAPSGRARSTDRYRLFSRVSRSDVAAYMLDAIVSTHRPATRTPMICTPLFSGK